jgi:hypothetical protein
LTIVGGVPTIATGLYPDYKTNISAGPTVIWEYQDRSWSKAFEGSVGQASGQFSFTDLTGDGIDELVVGGKFVVRRADDVWAIVPFTAPNQTNDGLISLDKNLRVTTKTSKCSAPPCPTPTTTHWRFDEASNSFVPS